MREPFANRAQEMGLDIVGEKGCFTYEDQYSEVAYRVLYTGFENLHSEHPHPTDGLSTPIIAIFTRPTDSVDFRYAGYVSHFYQFIGNDVLCQKIRESIREVGMPIVTENVFMSWDYTRLRNEMIIQSSLKHPQAGDILPVMVVSNSYNGTCAATISFGLCMEYRENYTVFAFSLGKMRQVHIQSSSTEISSLISSYMEVFSENISDMISQSFTSRLTENDMMSVLDVIEQYGKKRRDRISALLQEIQPTSDGLPSAWQVFLAIVRYSSFEQNLNIKKLLENAAQSVLVIPARMNEVLERL